MRVANYHHGAVRLVMLFDYPVAAPLPPEGNVMASSRTIYTPDVAERKETYERCNQWVL